MKEQIPGSFRAGDMWSFRSEAADDLDKVYKMLSDIPKCDTKKEMISLIRRSYAILNEMERRVKEKGTIYMLGDDDDE